MSSSKEKNIGFYVHDYSRKAHFFQTQRKNFQQIELKKYKNIDGGKNRNNFKTMKFNNEMEIFPLKLFSKFSLS
jgi:hypothetical protein